MLRPNSPRKVREVVSSRESTGSVAESLRRRGNRVVMYLLLLCGILFFLYTDVDIMNATRSTTSSKLAFSQITTLAESSSALSFFSQWPASPTKPNRPARFSFHPAGAGCRSAVVKSVCPLVLVGSNPSAVEFASAALLGLGLDKVVVDPSVNELAQKNLNYSLAAQILSATQGSVEYEVKTVPAEISAQVAGIIASMKELIQVNVEAPAVLLIDFPAAIYFMPFLMRGWQADCAPTFALITQNAVDAVFEDVRHIAKHTGPMLSSEEVLDTLCVGRLREMKPSENAGEGSSMRLTPSIKHFESFETADVLSRFDKKAIPCTVTEVPILRAAQLWASLNSAALDWIESSGGFVLRVEDLVTKESAQRTEAFLADLLGKCVSGSNSSSIGFKPVRKSSVKLSSWSADARAHSVLLTQVRDVVGVELLDRVKYEADTAVADAVRMPTNGRVDAGYCWRYDIGVLKEHHKQILTFQYGYCLPSFIILGVQKASTDEVAVWLNFNVYSRRLDGGVEIHYFDCVGRGKGKYRDSCKRFRDQQMHWDSRSPVAKKAADTFSWSIVDQKSPYVDDIWGRYSKLGNLNWKDYTQRHTILFEKTPAYFDLAHPMDMHRLLPSAKLIVVLRDPVSRLYSGYWQSCTGKLAVRSDCTLADFGKTVKQAMNEGIETVKDPEFRRGWEHGKYIVHLNRWRKAYADDQIMIVFASHFKENPQAVIYFMECFLGHLDKKHHVYKPHEHNGYKVLGHYSKAEHPSHRVELPDKLRSMLNEHFRPWNKALLTLLRNSSIVSKPMKSQIRYNGVFAYPNWLKDA